MNIELWMKNAFSGIELKAERDSSYKLMDLIKSNEFDKLRQDKLYIQNLIEYNAIKLTDEIIVVLNNLNTIPRLNEKQLKCINKNTLDSFELTL